MVPIAAERLKCCDWTLDKLVNFLKHNDQIFRNWFVCIHYHLCKILPQIIECKIFMLIWTTVRIIVVFIYKLKLYSTYFRKYLANRMPWKQTAIIYFILHGTTLAHDAAEFIYIDAHILATNIAATNIAATNIFIVGAGFSNSSSQSSPQHIQQVHDKLRHELLKASVKGILQVRR